MSTGSDQNSTIAVLDPLQALPIHRSRPISSNRLYGSHFLQTQRAARSMDDTRNYIPGDPISLIDWRGYARTDQLLIRVRRDEAMATIRISVDTSPTLYWPDDDVDVTPLPVRKIELALRVASYLSNSHLRSGDNVYLGTRPSVCGARLRSSSVLVDLFLQICREEFQIGTIEAVLTADVVRSERAHRHYVVSDFLNPDFASALDDENVTAVQVLSSLEQDIDWTTGRRHYHAAARDNRWYRGVDLRKKAFYTTHLTAWQESLRKRAAASGALFMTVTDRTPIRVLEHFVHVSDA